MSSFHSQFARHHAAFALILGLVAVAFVLVFQATVHAQPTVVDWRATEYAFDAPESLPAGPVTVRLTNLGQEVHHGQLLRLNDGVTFEQFTAAVQTEGEAAVGLTSLEGGPGAIDPHGVSEVTLDLKPGNYVLACFIPDANGAPHLAKGMLKPLQVTAGELPAAALPDAPQTFTMKDFSFDLPASLSAGRATYRVVNSGQQAHELNMLKLAPGATEDDVLAWDSAPSGPPPFASVGGLNGLSAGGAGSMTLDLDPGTYVAVCHIPDPGSGVAHLHLGMIERFTVSG